MSNNVALGCSNPRELPHLRNVASQSKKSNKSFGSFFKLNQGNTLKVDLSEEQLKISEATNAALSNRHGLVHSRDMVSSASQPDVNEDQKRYGLTIKRGNFRKTQEDRVSILHLAYRL